MYVVYINTPMNKAIVHSDACAHYQRRKADSTPNGSWVGGFRSRNEALDFARSQKKARAESAKRCCTKL